MLMMNFGNLEIIIIQYVCCQICNNISTFTPSVIFGAYTIPVWLFFANTNSFFRASFENPVVPMTIFTFIRENILAFLNAASGA